MAGATGPKNLVLILDTSGSMQMYDRLSLLKTAAKAELLDPTPSAPPESPQKSEGYEELSGRMRRFLMLPDADGRDPKPLGEISALFLGLLTTPRAERQSLLLALCELIALVSGLFLSAPFDLRSSRTKRRRRRAMRRR